MSKPTVPDHLQDTFEKLVGPTQRAGITLERIHTSVKKKKVAPEALAVQMNANSANSHCYTAEGVRQMANLYEDSKSKVLVTRQQARGLSDVASGCSDLDPVPA